MRSLAFAIVASLAAGMALAQSADPGRDASRAAPRQEQSRAGTVTNPPAPGAAGAAGAHAGEDAESRAPLSATPHADGAAKQQAQAKRRAELEHCRTLTGESRADCIRRADAEYRRATSDDTQSGEHTPGPSLG